MSKKLFNEFSEITSKEWKQKIQFDLKGADYNETLIWNTPEGIDVKPFYHAEDFDQLPPTSNTDVTNWNIGQKIYAGNEKLANEKALDIIERGAESLIFTIPSKDIDFDLLLQNINLRLIPVYLEFEFLSVDAIKKLKSFISGKETQIYLYIDIIGHLAKTGNWYQNLKNDFNTLEEILTISKGVFKSTINVNLSLYQNAGANMVQQLAYTLAHANEYLNRFPQETITFSTAIGSNYFFEIAKLKALRLLWSSLAPEYNNQSECHIIATPSKRNKTLYDYNVNMLRTTTECMSAVLGGANMIYNAPYDNIYHKDNEFGERIARNQLLILKSESYFNKVSNPADGTYYIESITDQLAEKALDLFKQIETSGGFLKQLKNHTIQKKIKEAAETEENLFINNKETLIGTNKYQNPEDQMKNDLELYPFMKRQSGKTLIEPILEKRLAEALEQERLKSEA
ncbi:methylmalonyl-CoA mutase [Zhouia amylolytica]|uniref:Methylmalonyl-CoA mutase n=1 Tax=Zhouia amylolytica TaxID=376730 RepID=A0A1I6V1N3_9FLAO|nr:methylmalonyl-CoA mutase subunit beta [Zhouia amylolytica]MCQ0110078.1 methylmalonyl-CoA mutase subunit beta [Zhouia amylolytica]SFT07583.1 methylmalonyl-CoA mutase [Zhouia amylolytica]